MKNKQLFYDAIASDDVKRFARLLISDLCPDDRMEEYLLENGSDKMIEMYIKSHWLGRKAQLILKKSGKKELINLFDDKWGFCADEY